MNDNIEMNFMKALASLRGTKAGKILAVKPLYYKMLNSYLRRRPVEFDGFKLFLNPEDRVITEPMLAGEYEPEEIALIGKLVKPGDVVLDLGANIGYYSVMCATIAGASGRVYSFEPDPVNFGFLNKNIAVNKLKNVTAVDNAVSSEAGEHTFHINPDNKGDHRLYGDDQHTSTITVKTITVDGYLKEREKEVHFIKMDIQGAEIDALRGMKETISRSPDVRFVLEYWPYALKLAGHNPEELLDMLEGLGFMFYVIDKGARRLVKTDRAGILTRVEQSKKDDPKYADINIACFKNEKHIPASF